MVLWQILTDVSMAEYLITYAQVKTVIFKVRQKSALYRVICRSNVAYFNGKTNAYISFNKLMPIISVIPLSYFPMIYLCINSDRREYNPNWLKQFRKYMQLPNTHSLRRVCAVTMHWNRDLIKRLELQQH